jgi:N-acyl-D-aspartate/D-glutamate deacylase
MRNESDFLIDSVMEAVAIGRNSGARVEISHLKTSGKRNFGLVKTVLDLMAYYRRFGIEVTGDTYPCIFGHTGLQNCFPAWTRAQGPDGFLEFLKDDEKKKQIKYELARPSVAWENILLDAGFDETIISSSEKFGEFEGKSVSEISRMLKKDPYETICDLIAEDLDISVLVGGLGKEDMEYALRHDRCMICSDAAVLEFGKGMYHPRNYRAFTRVLSKYVREEKLLTLEQAIRKMSSLPAWKLGLPDRGLLKPGMQADMAIFDPWTLNYTSEYADPHHYSEGMIYVLVNGRLVISEGNFTDEKPGVVLKKYCLSI